MISQCSITVWMRSPVIASNIRHSLTWPFEETLRLLVSLDAQVSNDLRHTVRVTAIDIVTATYAI